jgi:ribosomal protection tetracycline resistance protein
MSNRWVIVDGYSVLHAWPKLLKLAGRALEQRRGALVRVLRQFADHSGRRVTVVFDGYAAKHKPEVVEPSHGVEVLFSEKGKTADDAIERLVAQAEHRERILVVTSDNMERHTVESLGAHSVSAEVFEAEVESELRELARSVRHHGRRRHIGRIGERLDD